MIIETAALTSFGSWIALKIADKGLESVYKKVTSSRAGALDKTKKRLVWHVPSGRASTDVAKG